MSFRIQTPRLIKTSGWQQRVSTRIYGISVKCQQFLGITISDAVDLLDAGQNVESVQDHLGHNLTPYIRMKS